MVLLFSLASYPPLWLALVTLIMRHAVMNGAWSLQNVIQFEYSPRQYRNVLQSLTSAAFWIMLGAGHVIGGYLADLAGFWILFLITASLYLIGTLAFLRIRWLILALDPGAE